MKGVALRALQAAFPIITFLLIYVGLTQRLGASEPTALLTALTAAIIQGVIVTNNDSHIGGNRLLTRSQALAAARKRLREDYPKEEKSFPLWDLIRIPEEYKSKGIFVMGEQGSGKTVYLKYLINEALSEPNAKLVIHDYKMDIHPFLTGHLNIPAEEVKILHPYDKRSVGWDMQADIRDDDQAGEIAAAFVIDDNSKQPYFPKSARNLIKAVLCSFLYRSEENSEFKWGLSHLLEVLSRRENVLKVIGPYPSLDYARDALENDDVRATIFQDLGKLGTVAAMWAYPGKELVSLNAWRREEKREVLILGTDDTRSVASGIINRLLWTQLYKEVLDKSYKPKGNTWFFLDEFYLMEKLDGIDRFSSVARSQRGNLVLATQGISQVINKYRDETNILMNNLSTKIFFRCSGTADAKFAAEEIGKEKRQKKGTSVEVNSQGVSHGEKEDEHTENLLMAEDIKRLKKCTSERPLLDAVITTFIDDPFHYKMDFEYFRQAWPDENIESDYQPEDRRERMRQQPIGDEARKNLGLPKREAVKSAVKVKTGSDLAEPSERPRVEYYDGPRQAKR